MLQKLHYESGKCVIKVKLVVRFEEQAHIKGTVEERKYENN